MAVAAVLRNNFSAGELSPLMLARTDFERYQTGAKLLENWFCLLQGGVRTRYGTRFVVAAKYPDRLCLVRPFEATDADAYILEMGHQYIRFCRNSAQIQVASVPVEVATPYDESELRGIRTAQANDVMIVVQAGHAPQQLSRLSHTNWTFKPIRFDPPPLYESGRRPAATLTPSGLSGPITLTASADVFLETDVDRVIEAGDARVSITAVTSPTTVTGDVLSDFTDLDPIGAGQWTLIGSPVATLKVNKTQPVGAQVTLDLLLAQPDEPELVTNGDFAAGLTGWTDLSGPTLTTGTHTAANSNTQLTDSAANFVNVGIQQGHRILDTTDSPNSHSTVESLVGVTGLKIDSNGITGGTANNFQTGDSYAVKGTGGADVRSGKVYLTGGPIGIGWIEQGITTVVGKSYRLLVDNSEGAIAVMVGSASGKADLKAELSYPQGNNHEITFTAKTTTSYIGIRNNQPNAAAVDGVSCRLYSADGWHGSDVGRYVTVNDGLIQLTQYVDATRMLGTIVKTLSSADAAVAGAWELQTAAWSDERGWPSVICFFEGRLYFSGVAAFPQRIWASAVDDFYNFATGPNARDALELEIVDSAGNITLNQIRWLMPGENLLAGTTHAEYRLTGPTDSAFSAVDLPLVRLQSTFGSDRVQPVRVGQALLFAQRQGSKLRQMAFDADIASSFLARDLTALSGNLLRQHRIVELIYQPEPISMVQAIRSDGVILALTYDLQETVAGWSHWETDGLYESIATIPHPTANTYQVWVSVQRQVGGAPVRYLEFFADTVSMQYPTPLPDGTVPFWQGLTLDSAVVHDTLGSATVTGLDHLNGMMVTTVGDGAVFPPQLVIGGQVTLSQSVQRAWSGMLYVCTMETLPLDIPTRTGTSIDLEKAWMELYVRLFESVGLTVGGEMLPFRQPGMPMSEGVVPFTGKRAIIPPAEWSKDASLRIQQTQPLPATILSLSGPVDIGG